MYETVPFACSNPLAMIDNVPSFGIEVAEFLTDQDILRDRMPSVTRGHILDAFASVIRRLARGGDFNEFSVRQYKATNHRHITFYENLIGDGGESITVGLATRMSGDDCPVVKAERSHWTGSNWLWEETTLVFRLNKHGLYSPATDEMEHRFLRNVQGF